MKEMPISEVYISKEDEPNDCVDGDYFALGEGDDKGIHPAFNLGCDGQQASCPEPVAKLKQLSGSKHSDYGNYRCVQHIVGYIKRPIRQHTLRKQINRKQKNVREWQ